MASDGEDVWVDSHGYQHRAVDVFISSSHAQNVRAALTSLVERLTEQGQTVFSTAITAELPPGEDYRAYLFRYLETARIILVCWSPEAAQSEWVHSEAEYGRSKGKLVACKVARCEPPAPFNTFQFVDLTGWNGRKNHHGWRSLRDLIQQRLEGRPTPFDLSVKKNLSRRAPWWWRLLGR